ncbi:hypothetical protein [Lysobacter sp. Root96]|uniref:hypothetical protein n=1 Tax=Lysobacter sp. Root96 TaxID=1736612 RepID=UPI0006F72A74|nr:hypothetical protein [Lysobacter sp. Root96]KRD71437.1 hypothetical protein ASE45_06405 [Lysobacter sp. Root96]
MTHEAIAQALKIDRKTLSKHYELELSSGASLKRAEVMEKLFASAKKGSTSAARLYLQVQPEFTPVPLQDEKPSTEPKKGKKAQAQEDAGGAAEGTGWQDLLPANVTPLRPAG